jgi:hypothetical protein
MYEKTRPVQDTLSETDKGKCHENTSGLLSQVVTTSNDVLRSVILIPAVCRPPLQLHHIHSMAHVGKTKMRDFMVSRYIWPRMIQDIDEWTQNCLPCIRQKTLRPLRNGLTQSIVASRSLEKFCIDFVGPLTKDKNDQRRMSQNSYCRAYFSKWDSQNLYFLIGGKNS